MTPDDELGFGGEAEQPSEPLKITRLPLVSVDGDDLRSERYQEFYIPVHEFVRFSEEELAVINHPAFQRLGKIYQLGQSYYVYRGACHKRFEHVLGTVHVAQMMVDAVAENYKHAQFKGHIQDKCRFLPPFSPQETRFIRLSALLHDIGHLPFGHTLEDELCVLKPHDGDERLKLVFEKQDWIDGADTARLDSVINEKFAPYVPAGLNLTPTEIIRLLVSKNASPKEFPRNEKLRFPICRDVVGNTICADLLDYLYRDWYHVGKPKGFERRLFQYMQIREESLETGPEFVISYGHRNRPKRDAISAILELLESRYVLSETVLFHPTKCAAAAMLERGIFELADSFKNKDERTDWINALQDLLLGFSDEQALQYFEALAKSKKLANATRVFQDLINRRLYKSVTTATLEFDKVQTRLERRVSQIYLGINPKTKEWTEDSRQKAAASRVEAIRLLERDFELAAGSVVLYCPPFKMNAKIAEVKIEKGGAIMTLNEWDQSDEKLAGGHCAAQVRRFKGLWRMEVFIRESEKTSLQKPNSLKWMAFQRAVRLLIFGIIPDNIGTEEDATLALVNEMAAIPNWRYSNARKDYDLAARGKHSSYPLGALPLLSFLPKKNS